MATLPADGAATTIANNAAAKAHHEAIRDVLAQILGGAAEESLTIASGAVTPTVALVKVDTEGAAATDDLDSIVQTNLPAGSHLLVSSSDVSRVVVLKHATGNLSLRDGKDVKLEATTDQVWFKRVGSTWIEVHRNIGNRFERVVDFTTDQTLVPSDSHKIVTNRGAVADRNHTLPTPVAGMRYRARVVAAFKIKLTAAGGATIRDGATVSASNGNAEMAATIGNYFELEALSTTEWWVVSKQGTLTVT